MRVLFVTGEFPPLQGGVGDCTNEIAGALARCGVEAHVLTSATQDAPAEACGDGVRTHRRVLRWNWSSLGLVARAISDVAPDVVHIQYQTAAFGMHPAINLAPRRLRGRARFVTTFHDLNVPYLFPKAGPVRDWVTLELARSSAAAITTNEEDQARLESKLQRPVQLIPIGSNIAPQPPADYDRAAWRARLGIRPDNLLLCYFGFLNESKGGETLMRALARVPDARLLMVGGQVGASDPTNVRYLEQVKRLMQELGISDRVIWTDYVPPAEVSANLLAADAAVLPYRDGASFRRGSFMAALAHGLPVVTTRGAAAGSGGTPSAGALPHLADGENVLLVPPDDAEALARAIGRLAASTDLKRRLSAGALELADSFTWDKIGARHLELYTKLIGKTD